VGSRKTRLRRKMRLGARKDKMDQKYSEKYELTYITDEQDSLNEADAAKAISAEGAEVIAVSNLGAKNFAYPINKKTRGYYGVVKFSTSGENLTKIEKVLKLNKKIWRYLIVKDLRMPPPRVRIEKPEGEKAAKPEAVEVKKEIVEEPKVAPTPEGVGIPTESVGKVPVEKEVVKEVLVEKPEIVPTIPKIRDVGIPTRSPTILSDSDRERRSVGKKKQRISKDELDKKLEELIQE